MEEDPILESEEPARKAIKKKPGMYAAGPLPDRSILQ